MNSFAQNTSKLDLQEFCDMDQLHRLIDNWSKSTGMSAVIIDTEGNRTSGSFGMTDFCTLIHDNVKGLESCRSSWSADKKGIFVCPMGFCDFSIPIELPDGQVLGRVLAGQAISDDRDEEEIVRKAVSYGIDEAEVRAVLPRVCRKTEREIQGSYELLKETLQFFIEKNYHIREADNELKKAPAKNDRVLAQITQIMYSYNLTVDIATGDYTLITGTGMERTVNEYKHHSNKAELTKFQNSIIHPSYADRFNELTNFDSARNNAAENGFKGTLEYPVIYPDDDEFEWHEINVFVDTEEDGRRIANILGRDVTAAHIAQEKRENELRAAADKNRILSELTQMLYSYNLTLNLRTGKYSMIIGTGMTQFMEIFRSTDDYETAYNKKLSYLDPENVPQFAALASLDSLRARTNSNGFIGNLEYAAKTEKGIEWHEINIFLGTDENGDRIANILGRDITEAHEQQEKKERELRASNARDQLLSGVTKMLYSYNMTVNVDTGKYTLITGTGMEDTVARMKATDNYDDIYKRFINAVDDAYLKKGTELMALDNYRGKQFGAGHLGTGEFLLHYTKKPEWHEINVFAGYDEDGNTIINILGRDVTEAHDKADTKAQLEIANASSAAKSAFLFNMSHDIRTPMNAIIGFTELLDKHLDDKELAREYIKKIKTSNEFLLSLINNVLEMARIESGKTTLDESCWNCYAFNDTLYSLFDAQMKEKGIEFTRSVEVEHTEVICDATKLREIFLNILSNALKYTPSGGRVTMRLTEVPSDRAGHAMYKTEIEDTGIGISEEFLPKMFDEFTRERSSTESRVNGTGLGMAIVKRLVDFLGGTIKVESRVGKGTKFTVTIPHRIADKRDNVQSIESDLVYDAEKFKGKRILLAEDNELNAEIAMTILEESGFKTEHAADGIICADMLEKAAPGYYDLILMDIQMPNMDGYKATKTIRHSADRTKVDIPIIAMTANAFEEDKQNAYKAGMNGHIAKPINVSKLMAALARIL